MSNLFSKLSLFFATGLGTSFAVVGFTSFIKRLQIISVSEKWTGSGFWGTILGFLLVYFGFPVNGIFGLVVLVLFTLFAIVVSSAAEEAVGVKDDQRIIIDEIVGYFWACSFLPEAVFGGEKKLTILIAAFILFRIFDVTKLPFPQAQNLQKGIGIVADDFFAGLLANLILQIGIRFVI